MTTDYDQQQATTIRLRALSQADAQELRRQVEAERRAVIIQARRDRAYWMREIALGLLGGLGAWKLIELIIAVRHMGTT